MNKKARDAGLQAWVKNHSSDPSTPYNPKLVPCTDATIYLWADANHQPPLILVPTTCKRSIFNHFHSLSHPGGKETYKLIKNTHYWPDMQKEISEWCKTCVQCQKNKVNRHTTSYLQALPKPTNRFSHMFHLLRSSWPNLNVHLLTVHNGMTRSYLFCRLSHAIDASSLQPIRTWMIYGTSSILQSPLRHELLSIKFKVVLKPIVLTGWQLQAPRHKKLMIQLKKGFVCTVDIDGKSALKNFFGRYP